MSKAVAVAAAPKYTDGNDPEFLKLKKVVLECQPFAEHCASIVCCSCFRLLVFPAGASAIQCGACQAVCKSVQAKCVSCAHTMKIPLGASEVQCPNCMYSFKPMATMRVQVPETLALEIPPPIRLNVVLHESVGTCSQSEFQTRVVVSRALSANIAGWELQSGARFHRVEFRGTDSGVRLEAAKTPAELGLADGDSITVQAAQRASASGSGSGGEPTSSGTSSSSGHDFQVTTLTAPTNCGASGCGKFIWGLAQQGKKCVRCGLTVHHRCADEVSGMCDAARRQLFGIQDFGGDDDEDWLFGENDAAETNKNAVIAVPVEDPVAFMAACKPDPPVECTDAMKQLNQLASFTDEQIASLWTKYDSDSSGVLEKAEAEKFVVDVVSSFGAPIDPKDPKGKEVLARFLRRLDTNEDGVVSWEEFYSFFNTASDLSTLESFAGIAELSTEQMYELWNRFDADGSGELTSDEVLELLAQLTKCDAKVLASAKAKKTKLSSFVKSGQSVTWDTFYNVFIPIIQDAVKNKKPSS